MARLMVYLIAVYLLIAPASIYADDRSVGEVHSNHFYAVMGGSFPRVMINAAGGWIGRSWGVPFELRVESCCEANPLYWGKGEE